MEEGGGEGLSGRANRHITVGCGVHAEGREARHGLAGALRNAALIEQVERLGGAKGTPERCENSCRKPFEPGR